MESAQRHHVISRVAPLLRSDGPLVELLVDLPKPAADALVAERRRQEESGRPVTVEPER
jgi:hypothetical protein